MHGKQYQGNYLITIKECPIQEHNNDDFDKHFDVLKLASWYLLY